MNAPLNFAEMASRDPALAAVMGALPGYDFGYSTPSRPAYSAPVPQLPALSGVNFGDDGMGFGYGFGVSAFDPSMNIGFGRHAHGHPGHHPHAHHAHAHHPHHAARVAALQDPTSTASRTMLLDPNANSAVKVERYSFSFGPSANLVLGTLSAIPNFTQQPSASIKGQRIVMNAPAPNFVFVTSLQIANVNVLVGGQEDAFTYSAGAQGVMLDLPRLDPQNRATSSGNYTGSLPVGFAGGAAYTFIITLQGPAVLAGGYGQ